MHLGITDINFCHELEECHLKRDLLVDQISY